MKIGNFTFWDECVSCSKTFGIGNYVQLFDRGCVTRTWEAMLALTNARGKQQSEHFVEKRFRGSNLPR